MMSAEARLLSLQLGHVETSMKRQDDILSRVDLAVQALPAMQAALLHLREQMDKEFQRGSKIMSDHEDRLKAVERDMPGLKELRKYVVAGVVAGIGLMAGALAKLVIIDVPRFTAPPAILHVNRQSKGYCCEDGFEARAV